MVNPIVSVIVTQSVAPTPNGLQKTGALISQGGTNLGAQNYGLLTAASDLAALLPAPLTLSNMTWASTYGGLITATASAAHGVAVGDQFVTTVAGAIPEGYNGTYVATASSSTAFTMYQPTNPGASPATTFGTYTARGVGDLQAMVNTFFAQGDQQAVYALELGAGEAAAGVTALTTFIANNPGLFYSYLTPRDWDGVSSFISFLAGFTSTTAKTYFYVTTSLQNYALYANLKCVLALIEAPSYGAWPADAITDADWTTGVATLTTTTAHTVKPGQYFTINGVVSATIASGFNGTFLAQPGTTGSTLIYNLPGSDPGAYVSGGTLVASIYSSAGIPATEFTHASDNFVTLNYAPSNTNKVPQLGFSFLFSVTPFPPRGNGALLQTLKTANVNYVGVGSEGGIENDLLYWGHTMDGRPFNYWYSIDWIQINVAQALANAVINGSNDPINPLYYNQQGIDRLQQVAAATGQSAVTFGLALGSVILTTLTAQEFINNFNAGKYLGNIVINAIPFTDYTAANPGDYKIGRYAGLAISYPPLRGFESIIVNINATDFV